MIITKTAVVFTMLGLGLGMCGWQFLRTFRKESSDSKAGLFLSTFIFFAALQNITLGLGVLFFVRNAPALASVYIITQILLATQAFLGIYVVYYIFSKTLRIKIGMGATVALGIILVGLTVIERPEAIITKYGNVDWAMSYPLSLATFLMLSISIGSFIYIFLRLFKDAITRKLKYFSLGLASAGIVALAGIFVKFVLLADVRFAVGRYILEGGIGIAAILFILVIIFLPAVYNLIRKSKK